MIRGLTFGLVGRGFFRTGSFGGTRLGAKEASAGDYVEQSSDVSDGELFSVVLCSSCDQVVRHIRLRRIRECKLSSERG